MGPHGFRASHANFVGDGVAAAPAARRPPAAKISPVRAAASHTASSARGPPGGRAARATARRARGDLPRDHQPLRRRLLLLAAALLRLRPLLRARPGPARGHRRLLPLRGLPAADPGPGHLPRDRRHHDGDARVGRHAAGGAGERAPRDPPLRPVSPQLVHAFLAAEDRRFYEHQGLDYRGIARALGANLRAGEVAQGGSTITQQVAKSFLSSERTHPAEDPRGDPGPPPRGQYSKREILTLYLNQVFLGHGAYGVAAAARIYFDKPSRRSRPRRDGAPGRARARAFALFAAHQPGRRAHPPRSGAGRHGRRRLSHRRRGQPLARTAGGHPPAPRFLPHRRPLFRRAGAPRHHPPLRQKEALRRAASTSRPPSSPGSNRRRRRTSTSRCASSTSGKDGAGPWRASSGAAADEFRRRVAARYGGEPPDRRAPLSRPRRGGDRRAAAACAGRRQRLPARRRPTCCGPFPYSAKDAVNDRKLDRQVGVLRAGDVIWVKNALQSKRARFSDWTYDSESEVQWLPAYDETAPAQEAPSARHRWS